MRFLFSSDVRSFFLLNATQFLGALNDNIFKLLVIYLLISLRGPEEANTILSLVGAIFVIPFLLFSSSAGVLADKISKRKIIVYTKALECLVMLFAVYAFWKRWDMGAYGALFCMAWQSALFGPSKYGIIPELVEEKKISKANGSLTSFTYLAIILGTFLASFFAQITEENFVVESIFCVVIAVIGLCTSLGIQKTKPVRSKKKIHPFFFYEIYQTLRFSWKIPHLLPAIFGSSFFLFIGAFTQLNIIPFAMQSLGLTAIGGGYLFLATAVGIAIGAILSGQIAKDKVEPGISCIAGFFISLFFFLLYFFSSSLWVVIFLLMGLGVVGGGYLIPFDAFLQVNSPEEKRGQIIATANFCSFVGVLCAALFLFFVVERFHFSAAGGFVIMGGLSLVANVIVLGRLSALFFPFFVKKILQKFRKLELLSPVPEPSTVILLQSNSWWDAILLFGFLPHLRVVVPIPYWRRFPWCNGFLDTFEIIPPEITKEKTLKKVLSRIENLQKKHARVCLFFHRRDDMGKVIAQYEELFRDAGFSFLYAHGKKERTSKRIWGRAQRKICLTFSPK